MRRPIVFLDESGFEKYKKEFDLSLVEGEFGGTDGRDIVVSQRAAKNKDFQIGDEIGNQVDTAEVGLIGRYSLTGIIEFNDLVLEEDQFQTGVGEYDPEQSVNTTLFIHPTEGRGSELDDLVVDIQSRYDNITIETERTYIEYIDGELQSIGFLLSVITIAVSIVVTLSVGLLATIFLNQRLEEIGLLLLMGYTKSRVIFKIISEMTIQVILGWVVGLCFTAVVYYFLNQQVFEPQAIIGLSLWTRQTFITSVPIPLSIMVFVIGYILWKIKTLDPVNIIEQR
jgi:ABC-type antimicrobial peptide transport system permease subunit